MVEFCFESIPYLTSNAANITALFTLASYLTYNTSHININIHNTWRVVHILLHFPSVYMYHQTKVITCTLHNYAKWSNFFKTIYFTNYNIYKYEIHLIVGKYHQIIKKSFHITTTNAILFNVSSFLYKHKRDPLWTTKWDLDRNNLFFIDIALLLSRKYVEKILSSFLPW